MIPCSLSDAYVPKLASCCAQLIVVAEDRILGYIIGAGASQLVTSHNGQLVSQLVTQSIRHHELTVTFRGV